MTGATQRQMALVLATSSFIVVPSNFVPTPAALRSAVLTALVSPALAKDGHGNWSSNRGDFRASPFDPPGQQRDDGRGTSSDSGFSPGSDAFDRSSDGAGYGQSSSDGNRGDQRSEADDHSSNLDGSSDTTSGDDATDDGIKTHGRKSSASSPSEGDDPSQPPRTVAQWLNRMFSSNAATSKKAAMAKPRVPSVRNGETHREAFSDIAGPQLLALHVTPDALARAQSLGFRIKPATNFANLALSVTEFIPPAGMNLATAEDLLSTTVGEENLGYNHKYRIYKTAAGISEIASSDATSNSDRCSADHCFGRELISWTSALSKCASNIRIGLIDTSVDLTHPSLARKIIGVGHLSEAGEPAPNWHGTGVLSLLAGSPVSGTPGLIPDAEFVIADIFRADSDGQPASDTKSMLRALDWLSAQDVKIINMSLSGPRDELVRRAIAKLAAEGILFVAASGNEGPSAPPSYPAAYPDVIAVTAVSKDLHIYRYANRGDYIDVAAPGVGIWTALPDGQEGYQSGTSFAAPYVTAALAATVSTQNPASKREALAHLQFKDLGPKGRDPTFGDGLLIASPACGNAYVARAGGLVPIPRLAPPARPPERFPPLVHQVKN